MVLAGKNNLQLLFTAKESEIQPNIFSSKLKDKKMAFYWQNESRIW